MKNHKKLGANLIRPQFIVDKQRSGKKQSPVQTASRNDLYGTVNFEGT
ncbi:MAG TPA: hypothetical protein PLB55_15780 [Prosthecobacter sp.]|nr:hypothetical protein [Prosthecobacter sp.]